MSSKVLATALLICSALLGPSEASATPVRADQRVTLQVHQAEIVDVIRLLAEIGEVNVVIDDSVRGRVTFSLRDVYWKEALHAVLATRSLSAVWHGNIVRVLPTTALLAEQQALLRACERRRLGGPLVTRVIPVNNARAAELLPHVQAMLTERGSATVDERTNVIIVRDVQLEGPDPCE